MPIPTYALWHCSVPRRLRASTVVLDSILVTRWQQNVIASVTRGVGFKNTSVSYVVDGVGVAAERPFTAASPGS